MNVDLRVVSRYTGLLLFVLSALIATISVFAVVDADVGSRFSADFQALLIGALVGAVLAAILVLVGRSVPDLFGQREAILLVALSWIVGAALAALPFYLWALFRADSDIQAHSFDSYVNCYFEAVSGLTTTGATVLPAIGTVPRSLLLWRAMTQWLGGLGIVVLFVAVLPMLGVGGRRLYRMEAPGPSKEGVKPRIQDTARTLWFIYLGLTTAEVLALKFCNMSWFDAVCHALTTLATGGFSTLDSSIAGYQSYAIHFVIILFMVFAGINFGLYHQLLQREWRRVWKDPELRAYLGIIAAATIVITFSLYQSALTNHAGTGEALPVGRAARDALFQVVSMQTTTGFCSADFDAWGFVAKATLLALMFIGGSAGSTGGGIKVLRILIAAKVLLAEVEHVYRPKVVRTLKIGRATIDDDLKRGTLVYILGIALLFVAGTGALMLLAADEPIDITTAATASIATLNNIGPGLARVGATQNYAWFSGSGKIVMSILMILGRLEMFTIIVLFSPRFWRSE